MVIIIALIVFLVIFFLIRHHTGPAHLATIAGLSVFALVGEPCTAWLEQLTHAPAELLSHIIYLVLIVGFPILLYLRSSRGGLKGILRLAEAAIFAILLTSLISEPLAYFFPFDDLAHQLSALIANIEAPIVVAGIAAAYLDLIFCRPNRRYRR